METLASTFLMVTGATAVLALFLGRGQRLWVRLLLFVALEAIAIPCGSFYGAYSIDALVYSGRQAACRYDLHRIGIAMESFRRDHGKYPTRLEQLTPHYLKHLPSCPDVRLRGAYMSDNDGGTYTLKGGRVTCPAGYSWSPRNGVSPAVPPSLAEWWAGG